MKTSEKTHKQTSYTSIPKTWVGFWCSARKWEGTSLTILVLNSPMAPQESTGYNMRLQTDLDTFSFEQRSPEGSKHELQDCKKYRGGNSSNSSFSWFPEEGKMA